MTVSDRLLPRISMRVTCMFRRKQRSLGDDLSCRLLIRYVMIGYSLFFLMRKLSVTYAYFQHKHRINYRTSVHLKHAPGRSLVTPVCCQDKHKIFCDLYPGLLYSAMINPCKDPFPHTVSTKVEMHNSCPFHELMSVISIVLPSMGQQVARFPMWKIASAEVFISVPNFF